MELDKDEEEVPEVLDWKTNKLSTLSNYCIFVSIISIMDYIKMKLMYINKNLKWQFLLYKISSIEVFAPHKMSSI